MLHAICRESSEQLRGGSASKTVQRPCVALDPVALTDNSQIEHQFRRRFVRARIQRTRQKLEVDNRETLGL